MPSVRRMGPQDSATSNALLDAAERVLRNEGHSAATSRRIAQEAGLKQQLVYYYFRIMDDLLLATFQRRAARAIERLQQSLATEPLAPALWHELATQSDPKLASEYMSLAERNEPIRAEVADFVKRSRRLQTQAVARLFADSGIDAGPLTPSAAALILNAVSLLLAREAASGIDEGHADVAALVAWTLRHFDR